MTTVAALAYGGDVWMVGDTATTLRGNRLAGSLRKVLQFSVGDDTSALLGVSGDGALAHLAQRVLADVAAPGRDVDAWAHRIASVLTLVAVRNGLVDDGRIAGTMLLGYAGKLWALTHHQALPIPDGYTAVGSGGDIALGVLAAMAPQVNGPHIAVKVVRDAVLIAGRFDLHTDGVGEVMWVTSAR